MRFSDTRYHPRVCVRSGDLRAIQIFYSPPSCRSLRRYFRDIRESPASRTHQRAARSLAYFRVGHYPANNEIFENVCTCNNDPMWCDAISHYTVHTLSLAFRQKLTDSMNNFTLPDPHERTLSCESLRLLARPPRSVLIYVAHCITTFTKR